MNNRFFILAAGVVILLNTAVFAQVSVWAGATGGLGMFNEKASGEGALTRDMKMGLVAGVVLDVAIVKMFSVEAGVGYSQRGSQIVEADGAQTKNNLSYLSIPVHAKLKYAVVPVISPFLLIGLNTGVLVSAQQEHGGEFIDIKDGYNSTDYGLDLGAGVEFSLANPVPFVEFVYNTGLSNLAKNATGDYSVKNNGMEIKAGLKFKL